MRVASRDARYRQIENAYARVPGVAPVRMVRQAGRANAIRYLLPGDIWYALTAYRLGIVHEVAATKKQPSRRGSIGQRNCACGPLGIKAVNDTADVAAGWGATGVLNRVWRVRGSRTGVLS